MINLSTYIDRYPAKMVSKLAGTLIEKYTSGCLHLFDPFCGSSAILTTGKSQGLSVSGTDINPYAVLLSEIKLNGFDKHLANKLAELLVKEAKGHTNTFPVTWKYIKKWFTKTTLNKYERLRYTAREMNLGETREGRAVLLALALSVRKCSLADQRSPKYFISKTATKDRRGKHFNPFPEILDLMNELIKAYGQVSKTYYSVSQRNFASVNSKDLYINTFSHVITSPPYINAQDYFRNFQLELYLLEELLPFKAIDLKDKFVGTERGDLLNGIPKENCDLYEDLLPCLISIKESRPQAAAVICKYFYDMDRCFDTIKQCLIPQGKFILVCGDNLVSGYSIPTWEILNSLLERKGFVQFDRFGDPINRRLLAPKRNGHKGLMKEEIISAFTLPKNH